MATQYTDLLGLMYPGAPADLLPQADLEASAKAIDSYFAKTLTHLLPKGGFLTATDFNVTAGTGLEILVSPGAVFNLTANGPKLNINSTQDSLTPSNSGMVSSGGGGTLNYLWVNGDGTYTVEQTGVAPTAASQLAASFNAVTTPAISGINNFPTGRYNLDQRNYVVQVTWDPPSIANGAAATTTVTVTGARVGDSAIPASVTALTAGMYFTTAHVTANDTVRLTLVNLSGGTVDLGSLTINVFVRKF